MGYVGSEEFIRLQFEEYLLSLISAVKCHNYLVHHANNPRAMLPQVEGDPTNDFGIDWIEAWTRSENYRIWDRFTDSHLFDIVEPKHPCAGGLTIDDVQRRLAEQVKEFHLDERFAVGKEVLGRNLQAGREKASTVFSRLYADMEALRESQRRKYEEQKLQAEKDGLPTSPSAAAPGVNGSKQTVGSKAGSYIGSWSTWMGEKRKTGWGRGASSQPAKEKENVSPGPSTEVTPKPSVETSRLKRHESYQESIFDADSHDRRTSVPAVVEVLPDHTVISPEAIKEEAAPAVQETGAAKRETTGSDAETRHSAVAEAVEAATATPISP